MYGKDKDGKKLIDNINEMKVIRYMKTLRTKGWSYLIRMILSFIQLKRISITKI